MAEVNDEILRRREVLAEHYKDILNLLGENTEREGLVKTPTRVAKAMQFLTKGYGEDPEAVLRSAMFKEEDYKQMVIVKDIPFSSLCEHHILPFTGRAHVCYIPRDGRITGLSKIARCVSGYARRLQVQERLTGQIADAMVRELDPLGVLVVLEAEHTCMTMRGVRAAGALTTTSAVRGCLRDLKTRQEALRLLGL